LFGFNAKYSIMKSTYIKDREGNLMEWIIILLIVIFFVWRMMPKKGISSISTEELKGMLKDKSKQFLDVRTPGEYKGRHIKEFKNIPLNTLNSQLGKFDKSKINPMVKKILG